MESLLSKRCHLSLQSFNDEKKIVKGWRFNAFIGSDGAGFMCSREREEARIRALPVDIRSFVSH